MVQWEGETEGDQRLWRKAIQPGKKARLIVFNN